jgi:glycosyltransferase involved in cell wall biosynthesis
MTFAVIIPIFNGEKYLEETILSVLNQSRKADEIIVYDDGSHDGSGVIARKYLSKIKYIRNENGPSGFVNAWNNAIKCSSSDYISVLHQDDLLANDFLLIAENVLKIDTSVMHFFTLCSYIDKSGNEIKDFSYSKSFEGKDKFVIYDGNDYMEAYQRYYGKANHIHRCPGVVTHRSIFFDLNCWYNPLAGHIADDDFFYRVGFLTRVKGFLQPMAFYRIHQDSETSSIGDLMLVIRLSNDYLFQLKQWASNNSVDSEQKEYFKKNFLKYTKRLIGYSLKHQSFKILTIAIKNYIQYLIR